MTVTTGILANGPVLSCVKDPSAVLDYGLDWTTWLAGDTINTSTWTVSAGITKTSESVDPTNKATTIWLSGGTAGVEYDIVNRIVTVGGRTDERTIRVIVRER